MKNLDDIALALGNHIDSDDGMCAMEAVAWLADEPHSDRPKCASPVISFFVRYLNDSLDDEARQVLKNYVPRLIGSKNQDKEKERAKILAVACAKDFLSIALKSVSRKLDFKNEIKKLKSIKYKLTDEEFFDLWLLVNDINLDQHLETKNLRMDDNPDFKYVNHAILYAKTAIYSVKTTIYKDVIYRSEGYTTWTCDYVCHCLDAVSAINKRVFDPALSALNRALKA